MKKTLITLMSLAGVAMGNTKVVEPAGLELLITDNSIGWVYAGTTDVAKDITSSNATMSNGSFTTNGTNAIGDRLGSYTGYTPIVAGIVMNTFTLTFTADWTRNDTGASMLMSWGEGGNWGFGFGVGEDGNWTIVQGQYNKPVTINTSGIAAVDGGAQEFTIIGRIEQMGGIVADGGAGQRQGRYHVQAYAGEDLVYSAIYGTEEDKIGFGQSYDPHISFGAGLNGANGTVMTVSNATLYIPEPATATLSLLALCGLAARRRRK